MRKNHPEASAQRCLDPCGRISEKRLPISAIGIDLGYSDTGATSAISFFAVVPIDAGTVVDVASETEVLAASNLLRRVADDQLCNGARIVAIDAPLTPQRITARPASGRVVDARFSRGDFSNGRRGLQPGSISTPVPGWKLYEAGMALLTHLTSRGFSYLTFQASTSGGVILPQKAVVEVIPKLTQGLLAPRALVVARPRRGGFQKVDDWLFPHLFVTAPVPAHRATDQAYPRHGTHHHRAMALIGSGVQLGARGLIEANRILGLSRAARHEALAAFVAGFQAALALAGRASMVGAVGPAEGYFLLPSTWHSDWESSWTATALPTLPVRRLAVGC